MDRESPHQAWRRSRPCRFVTIDSASSRTAPIPRRSISFIVKTRMPDFLTSCRSRVDLTNSDHGQHARAEFGCEVENMCQFKRAVTHDSSHRHTVNVAARRDIRCVEIGVGIKPQQSDFLAFSAESFRYSGNSAYCNRVVPAQNQRNASFLRTPDDVCKMGARVSDFFRYFARGSPKWRTSGMITSMSPKS